MAALQPAVGVADMGARALQRHQEVLAERIMDDAGDRFALRHDRQHDAEQRQAGGEVEGAVDRIDDEGQIRFAKTVEHRRVGGVRLLADHQRIGKALAAAAR